MSCLWDNLLIKLDGQTLSLNSFNGVIGKKFLDCEKFPIRNFQPVKIDQISTLNSDLGTDQQYLREKWQIQFQLVK